MATEAEHAVSADADVDTDTQSEADASSLSAEVVFEILSNARRRHTIRLLRAGDGTVELRTLAESVAGRENGVDPADVSANERKSVYTALRQSHLPKMERMGVVEFDQVGGDVTLTPAAEQLEVYLDVVEGDQIPWSEVYLALGAIGCALVAALWAGAYPLTLLPDLFWAGAIAVAVTLSAGVHVATRRGYLDERDVRAVTDRDGDGS